MRDSVVGVGASGEHLAARADAEDVLCAHERDLFSRRPVSGRRAVDQPTAVLVDDEQPHPSAFLTDMKKHVSVLENAGLVTSEKVGRVRQCRIGGRRLEEVASWIDRYHQLWDARFSALDDVIEDLKLKEQNSGRNN